MFRASLESRLNRIWYRGEPAPLWLRCLVPVYKAIFRLSRWWQSRRTASDLRNRCIIVVGNLTVGGSGKTPLLIRICTLLKSSGLSVGVVSRGYGRKDRKQRFVMTDSPAELVGDEPLLIFRRAKVPVVVGRDRARAARTLFKQGVDVVVSDDGLQHHRLPRSHEICVVNADEGFGNGQLLPAGPLREPLDRLRTVEHVIVNGGHSPKVEETLKAYQKSLNIMEIQAGHVQSLGSEQSWRLSQFRGCRVHGVAGIANPDRFFTTLRHAGMNVEQHVFPDHYNYSRSDFEGLGDDLPVIMTEKDAVKCAEIAPVNSWYLQIDAALPHAWEAHFVGSVLARIKANNPEMPERSL